MVAQNRHNPASSADLPRLCQARPGRENIIRKLRAAPAGRNPLPGRRQRRNRGSVLDEQAGMALLGRTRRGRGENEVRFDMPALPGAGPDDPRRARRRQARPPPGSCGVAGRLRRRAPRSRLRDLRPRSRPAVDDHRSRAVGKPRAWVGAGLRARYVILDRDGLSYSGSIGMDMSTPPADHLVPSSAGRAADDVPMTARSGRAGSDGA